MLEARRNQLQIVFESICLAFTKNFYILDPLPYKIIIGFPFKMVPFLSFNAKVAVSAAKNIKFIVY